MSQTQTTGATNHALPECFCSVLQPRNNFVFLPLAMHTGTFQQLQSYVRLQDCIYLNVSVIASPACPHMSAAAVQLPSMFIMYFTKLSHVLAPFFIGQIKVLHFSPAS